MTTPIIVLVLLIGPYLVCRFLGRRRGNATLADFGGALGLGLAFSFFGVGHFAMTAPMSDMLPSWIPNRTALIYATGLLEFALAGAVVARPSRRAAGWACIGVLVGFFPANVYAAINHIGMGGHAWGPVYLLIRGPLQLLLIFWAYHFAARGRGRAL